MRFRLTTQTPEQTISVGRALAAALRGGDIVLLDGALGAGKTRLVMGLAQGLMVDPSLVASPTYVIVHQYPVLNHLSIGHLQHIDAYRLTSPEDLDSIGWEILTAPDAAVVVEWPSRIIAAFAEIDPARIARINLAPTDPLATPDRRSITIDLPESWLDRTPIAPIEALVSALTTLGASIPGNWARCATTGRAVAPTNPTFPFADDRARMADLGKWLSGTYSVSRELTEDDLDDPDLHAP